MGNHIIVKHVRCSFPQLYKAEVKGDQKFNPGITVLLDPKEHAGDILDIKNEIDSIIAGDSRLKKSPPKGNKLCLKGPDSESYRDEYPPGCHILKAGNTKGPLVLHKDLSRMTEDDDKIYSGCYVNVKVELWGQDNQFGKRVNAKLLAVQFSDDGESFDGSYVSEETAAEGFGALEDGKTDGGGQGFLE